LTADARCNVEVPPAHPPRISNETMSSMVNPCCASFVRLLRPIRRIPNKPNGMNIHKARMPALLARFLECSPVPVVVTITVTEVDPAPGVSKLGATVQLARSGAPLQDKLTGLEKAPPTEPTVNS
jgi:hypothetical protein